MPPLQGEDPPSLLPLISSLASPADYLASVLLPSLRCCLGSCSTVQDLEVTCREGARLATSSFLLASASPWLASLLVPGCSLVLPSLTAAQLTIYLASCLDPAPLGQGEVRMVHRLLQGEVLDLEGVQESRLVHRLLQREVLEGVQKVQDLQELQEVRQIRRLLETNQLVPDTGFQKNKSKNHVKKKVLLINTNYGFTKTLPLAIF